MLLVGVVVRCEAGEGRRAVRQDCRNEEERESMAEVGVVWGIAVGVGSVGGVYRQLQAGSSSCRGSGALEWPMDGVMGSSAVLGCGFGICGDKTCSHFCFQ